MAAGGAFGFVALLFLEHFLRQDLDPVSRPISDYGRGELSWIFSASLLALAASKAVVGLALLRAEPPHARPAGAILLVDAFATVLVALAPTDLGPTRTSTGRIHVLAATAAFLSSTAALVWASGTMRAAGGVGWALRALAGASALSLVTFTFSIVWGEWVGVHERVHVLVTAAWLTLFAFARMDEAGERPTSTSLGRS